MTEKQLAKLEEEKIRTELMYKYEDENASNRYICGIDEVGRGPLFGPVVTAAVILPKDHRLLYLNDSKKLSEKKRDELFEVITKEAVAIGIGIKDNNVIDNINILQATLLAMKEAVEALKIRPDLLLVDAVHIPGLDDIKQISIIKGDANSASIAAASIIAKVTRDRMMYEMDKIYPQYHLASNKGYGTAAHYEAIREYGLTKEHRKTFLKEFC